MDIRVSSSYLRDMIARLVALFAILAITVVTTVAMAHHARMSLESGSQQSAHVSQMMHTPDPAPLACAAEQPCGTADIGMCEVACAGLPAFLPSPGTDAGQAHIPAGHDVPPAASLVGHAPGLNDRPPKLRLL